MSPIQFGKRSIPNIKRRTYNGRPLARRGRSSPADANHFRQTSTFSHFRAARWGSGQLIFTPSVQTSGRRKLAPVRALPHIRGSAPCPGWRSGFGCPNTSNVRFIRSRTRTVSNPPLTGRTCSSRLASARPGRPASPIGHNNYPRENLRSPSRSHPRPASRCSGRRAASRFSITI